MVDFKRELSCALLKLLCGAAKSVNIVFYVHLRCYLPALHTLLPWQFQSFLSRIFVSDYFAFSLFAVVQNYGRSKITVSHMCTPLRNLMSFHLISAALSANTHKVVLVCQCVFCPHKSKGLILEKLSAVT